MISWKHQQEKRREFYRNPSNSCWMVLWLFIHKHTELIKPDLCHHATLFIIVCIFCARFYVCICLLLVAATVHLRWKRSNRHVPLVTWAGGEHWVSMRAVDHIDTSVRGPAALTWRGAAPLCVCGAWSEGNTGAVWIRNISRGDGEIYLMMMMMWRRCYSSSCMSVNAFREMCGQNIHLDRFFVLRGDLQVGGGVFALRMIICVFSSASGTSVGMLLFSLGSWSPIHI